MINSTYYSLCYLESVCLKSLILGHPKDGPDLSKDRLHITADTKTSHRELEGLEVTQINERFKIIRDCKHTYKERARPADVSAGKAFGDLKSQLS